MKRVEDWIQDAKMFEEKWDFPNCVGAIDGKHIRIFMPPHAESSFFNYKKFHSFVLLAICDAEYRFSWIAVGDYGENIPCVIFEVFKIYKMCTAFNKLLPDIESITVDIVGTLLTILI